MDFDAKALIAAVSAIVSIIALTVSWWLWRETNRPIVTVEIEADGGNVATTYHLIVHNCGNRPAARIRLSALATAKDAALSPNASSSAKRELYNCFSTKYEIALLRHGQSRRGGFGVTSTIPAENGLVYGASIPVVVTYEDLQGRAYKSNCEIVVRDTTSFNESWYV